MKIKHYELFAEGRWLANVITTENGLLVFESDYGDFVYRWNLPKESTMEEFILGIDAGYLASKFEKSSSYTFNLTRSARVSILNCCNRVLPELKKAISSGLGIEGS